MAEYTLHCFAQSGNAYRVALMLNLIGANWTPQFVDFFGKGLPRTPEWRSGINEMGEVPVLDHNGRASSDRRQRTSGWRRCAGSSSTTRNSTAIWVRIVSYAISPNPQATRP
jgi:hypothetical protein